MTATYQIDCDTLLLGANGVHEVMVGLVLDGLDAPTLWTPAIRLNFQNEGDPMIAPVTVTWTAEDKEIPSAQQYTHFQISITGRPPVRVPASQTSYVVPGGLETGGYVAEICACNSDGSLQYGPVTKPFVVPPGPMAKVPLVVAVGLG